jgi:DNA-binding NarL/FixJ family response regulator
MTALRRALEPDAGRRPAVGLMADEVSLRRLETALGQAGRVAARGHTVQELLDSDRLGFQVAVLAGGGELLARGGPVEALRKLRPTCSLVVVSPSAQPALIRKALRCGADGFVVRESAGVALGPAVAAVSAGQLSVPEAIRRRTDWSRFSVRERQVLYLAAQGLANCQIGQRLYLSESTIKSHLSSGFRKLGVGSRAEAAAAVLDPESGLTGQPVTACA